MKFPNFFGGEKPKAETETQYSAEKLENFLNEWAAITTTSDKAYAGDNEKIDDLLSDIVEQIEHLPKPDIEEAYISAGLSGEQKSVLDYAVYNHKKGSQTS